MSHRCYVHNDPACSCVELVSFFQTGLLEGSATGSGSATGGGSATGDGSATGSGSATCTGRGSATGSSYMIKYYEFYHPRMCTPRPNY